jgi:hypothetical protein
MTPEPEPQYVACLDTRLDEVEAEIQRLRDAITLLASGLLGAHPTAETSRRLRVLLQPRSERVHVKQP